MKTTGLGCLFKRGIKKIYYLQYSVNGSKKVISLKTSNKKIAQKKRDKLLQPALTADTKEKVLTHIAEARKLIIDAKYPLKETWDKYLASNKRPQSGEGTLGNYKRMWKQFIDWLHIECPAIEKINQITSIEAEKYSAFLWNKNITEDTFNYHLVAINLVFKILTEQTPFKDIKRKSGIQLRRKDFSPEQINNIFSVLDNNAFKIMNKQEMKLLCYVGAFTGLRLHDSVLLKTDSIDMIKNVISCIPVKTCKTQRQVHIPIHPELKKQFDYIDTRNIYVMQNIAKRYQKNPDGIKKDFLRILDKAGLTEKQERDRGLTRRLYGYHSFRHSFCSISANSGIPISTLAALLGDSTKTLEKYYVKISDKSKLDCINSLPAIIHSNGCKDAIDVKVISERDELPQRISKAIALIQDSKMNASLKNKLLDLLNP